MSEIAAKHIVEKNNSEDDLWYQILKHNNIVFTWVSPGSERNTPSLIGEFSVCEK